MMLTVRPRPKASSATAPLHVPETLLARLPAGAPLQIGTAVTITVRGPVTTWASTSASESEDTVATAA